MLVDPSGSQRAIAKPHLHFKQPSCKRVSGCYSPRGGSASRSVDGSPGTRHRAPASFSVLPAFLFYIEVHSALHDLGIWSCLPRSFSPLFLVFERRSMSGGSSAPPGFLGWRRVSARGWAFRGLSWIVWARWDCCERSFPLSAPFGSARSSRRCAWALSTPLRRSPRFFLIYCLFGNTR